MKRITIGLLVVLSALGLNLMGCDDASRTQAAALAPCADGSCFVPDPGLEPPTPEQDLDQDKAESKELIPLSCYDFSTYGLSTPVGTELTPYVPETPPIHLVGNRTGREQDPRTDFTDTDTDFPIYFTKKSVDSIAEINKQSTDSIKWTNEEPANIIRRIDLGTHVVLTADATNERCLASIPDVLKSLDNVIYAYEGKALYLPRIDGGEIDITDYEITIVDVPEECSSINVETDCFLLAN